MPMSPITFTVLATSPLWLAMIAVAIDYITRR